MSDLSLGTGTGMQNYTPKSFWKKPEGTMGMLLTAGAVGAGLWGAYIALPFLIIITSNALLLAGMLTALGVFGYIVTNTSVRVLAKNVFQSICRGLASFYTTVDSIGILRNNLDDMKTEKVELDQTVQRFAGSDERLKNKISQKQELIQRSLANAQQCEKILPTKTDPLERERIILKRQTELQNAGLLGTILKQLMSLKEDTSNMLTTFRHWSQIADSKIQRTEFQVEYLADQRSVFKDAQRTLSIGQRLLRGKPEQLRLVEMVIEQLAEDASRTTGEIREFTRYSDKLLTDIDIENGAQAETVKERFATFNQKLLSASVDKTADVLTNLVPSANQQVTVQDRGYDQLLGK